MDKRDRYLQSIQQAYPEYAIESAELNDRSQNSDVLVINRSWIFRFPKYQHVLDGLKVETSILKGVQPYVPLAIPVPQYLQLGLPVGRAFVGYRMIPGEPLWRDTFQRIRDEAVLDQLANQLAGFLRALHRIPVSDMLGMDLPVEDTREQCADLYGRMQTKLFHYMRPDARQWTEDHFERFLDDPANFDCRPVLKHSDFGPTNILFDLQTQTVTGIIDFGGSCLGDPAYDFAGLLSGFGEDFVQRCYHSYPEVEHFIHRTHFYKGTFALLEALFGVENDDPRAFEAGIQTYR